MKGRLAELKSNNSNVEDKLLKGYDNAQRQYADAIETYDQDMRQNNKDRDDQQADLEDHEYQLK